MPHRTISLSEDAYRGLVASKRPGESFSDVVRRLTRRRSITELAGLLPREAVDAVAAAIEANRTDRARVRKRELGIE